MEKQIDAAIFTKPFSDTNYHCEKIAGTNFMILASPIYIKLYGTPKQPEDLIRHNCLVHINRKPPFLWCFKNNENKGNLQFNNLHTLINVTKDGLYLVCLLPYNVHQELQRGQLTEILKEYKDEKKDYFSCYLKQTPMPEWITKFCEFLKEQRREFFSRIGKIRKFISL